MITTHVYAMPMGQKSRPFFGCPLDTMIQSISARTLVEVSLISVKELMPKVSYRPAVCLRNWLHTPFSCRNSSFSRIL